MAIDQRNVRVRCLNCGRLGTFLNGPNCLFCGASLPAPGAVSPPSQSGAAGVSAPTVAAPPLARAPVVSSALPAVETPPAADPVPVAPIPVVSAPIAPAEAWPPETWPAEDTPAFPPAPPQVAPYQPAPYQPAPYQPAPYQPAAQYRSPGPPPPQYYRPVPWTAVQAPPPRKSRVGGILKGIGAGLLFLLLVGAVRLGAYAVASGALKQLSLAGAPSSSMRATPWSNVVLSDSLKTNNGTWANQDGCKFAADGYHVSQGYSCYAPADAFQDAQLTVSVEQDTGRTDAYYGVLFRRTSLGNLYIFDITSGGTWAAEKVVNSKGSFLVPEVATPALHQGLGKANTLRVRMKGSQFQFFINGTQVGQASDTTFSSGRLGLIGSAVAGVDSVYTDFSIALP